METKLLNDIFSPIGDNIGGNLAFRFAPVDWIASIPAVYRGEVITPVVFKTDFTWCEGWAVQESMGAVEKQRDSKHGAYYEQNFKAIIPKSYYENEELYFLMRNLSFILNVRDANGEYKLYGSLPVGLKFTADKNTGTKHSELHHHSVEFNGMVLRPAPNYLIDF
jgi:hypothetical protein